MQCQIKATSPYSLRQRSTELFCEIHIQGGVKEGRKDFKCDLCDKEFTSAEFLKNHAKKIHGAKLKKQVKYVAVQNE